MSKNTLFLLFFTLSIFLSAQTSATEELALVETPEQVESYLKTKKSKKNKVIIFNEEIHKSVLARELFDLPKGGIKTIENEFDNTHYKVVERFENTYYRVSYITIDNTDLTADKVSILQDKIIRQFENGEPFEHLVKHYSTDENSKFGGDTGWFLEDDNISDLKKQIIIDKHALNDIFTLHLPETNKYYVILKTFEPKVISEMKVLKIVEPKK